MVQRVSPERAMSAAPSFQPSCRPTFNCHSVELARARERSKEAQEHLRQELEVAWRKLQAARARRDAEEARRSSALAGPRRGRFLHRAHLAEHSQVVVGGHGRSVQAVRELVGGQGAALQQLLEDPHARRGREGPGQSIQLCHRARPGCIARAGSTDGRPAR